MLPTGDAEFQAALLHPRSRNLTSLLRVAPAQDLVDLFGKPCLPLGPAWLYSLGSPVFSFRVVQSLCCGL